MIFSNNSTVKLESYYFPFNWGVDYGDGKYLTEFDLDSHIRNDFYAVQQSEIYRFGLFGYDMKFFYNIDGSFNLAGQFIEMEYHIDDTIIPLTISFEKKDCITYKNKEKEYNHRYELQEELLTSIDFGYKTMINYNGKQLFFQPLVKIPVESKDNRVKIEIKITSSENINGKLVMKNNDKIVDSLDFPLYENHSSIAEWVVQ